MAEFSSDALAAELQRVSDDIKRDIGAEIRPAADRMIGVLERRYPLGRKHNPKVPHMRDDMRVRSRSSNDHLLPKWQVVGPRLAYIWQNGTPSERYYFTQAGARHATGRMPAADPDFYERTSVQQREDMLRRMQAILDRPRTIG